MNASFRELLAWADSRRELWLDCVRVYLGIGLLVRGMMLFSPQPQALVADLSTSGAPWALSAGVLHYVMVAHLVGGVLLAVGLLTRLAALVQVPVVAGAVFFVHWNDGLLSLGQSLEFSALVLFLLCVFTVSGAGRLSLDHIVFGAREPSPDPRRSAPVLH
jgi:uncharacterized membrane protein YphA (DoxX/SURF4 family)